MAIAAKLTDESGKVLAHCQVVSTRTPPGQEPIDIIVSTPAGLVNMLLEFGDAYGQEWSAEALSQRVRHVVADEADMLVTNPAYFDPLTKFMDVRGLPFPCGSLLCRSCRIQIRCIQMRLAEADFRYYFGICYWHEIQAMVDWRILSPHPLNDLELSHDWTIS